MVRRYEAQRSSSDHTIVIAIDTMIELEVVKSRNSEILNSKEFDYVICYKEYTA